MKNNNTYKKNNNEYNKDRIDNLNYACEKLRNLESELMNIQNSYIIDYLDNYTPEKLDVLNDIEKISNIITNLTVEKIPGIIEKFESQNYQKHNYHFKNRQNNFINNNNVLRNNGRMIGNQNNTRRHRKIPLNNQSNFNPVRGINGLRFDKKNNNLISEQDNQFMKWVAEGYNNYDTNKPFDPLDVIKNYGIQHDHGKNRFIKNPIGFSDMDVIGEGLIEGLNYNNNFNRNHLRPNNQFSKYRGRQNSKGFYYNI